MASMGTFDAFTSARLGIYAAQHGLNVTGNNVSNINTVGYTRQRVEQVSFKAGAYDRYRSQLENHVGSGALVTGINQIRDPYLDVRFRNVSADVGYDDTMLAGLQNIADILDEVGLGEDKGDNEKGDGILHAQIQDLRDKLLAYSKEPTAANNNLVRTSASILCSTFNKYAQKLDTLYKETQEDFNSQVTEINECLTNIRDLNREIRDCEIYGDNALELRDERNRQIDKLSEYIHIKVIYTEEDVGAGQKVEKLSIYLDNENPDTKVHTDESMLIDGVFGAQLSSPETLPMANPDYDPANATSDTDYPKAYRYLKQAVDANGVPWYEDANGNQVQVNPGDPIPDGFKPLVGGGTNDPAEAIQLDNDNYGLQISKLVDVKNQLWEGVTRKWDTAVGGAVGAQAVYEFGVDPSGWDATHKFTLDGVEYAVGTDITVGAMNSKGGLAKFIASKLSDSPAYADYFVTASDDGTVRFTAKQIGAINSDGPAAAPGAIPLTGLPAGTVVGAGLTPTETVQGEDRVEPDNPPATQGPPYPYNPDGSQTIISYRIQNGVWMQCTTEKQHTYEVTLDDNDTHGSLQAVRELLTENGQFTTQDTVANVDENAASKRGIPYYQKALDLLAKEFAKQYNQLNQGVMLDENGDPQDSITGTIEELKALGVRIDKAENSVGGFGDGYYLREDGTFMGTSAHNPCNLDEAKLTADDTVADAVDKIRKLNGYGNFGKNADGTDKTEAEQLNDLKAFMNQHGVNDDNADKEDVTLTKPIKMGGPLFSTRNDNNETEGITASNISVSQGWTDDVYGLVPKYEVLWDGEVDHSTQNTNADHMVTMIDRGLVYNPKDLVPDAVSDKMFQGSFGDMFSRINTVLGQDIRATDIALNTSYTQQVEIDTNRDGVSGVDLNDEAMNMIQYQKAMSAAMRLMTVVDEVLDRLINNTGIAGR